MPPKKAAGAAVPKKSSASHPGFKDMIKTAITSLKERNGSSRQAIKKYVQANNNLGTLSEAAVSKHITQALASGEKSGDFVRPKGPSGPTKLAPKVAKPAAKKTTTTTTKSATKPGAKKATATKKTATTKKATAAKPKANTSKPRKPAAKKPTAAPAVEEKKPVVLGKTKSGRVTKSSAPVAGAAKKKTTAKKATTKKATPKKAAAK